MKKIASLLSVVMGFAFGAELKIGYIDSERIFREYQGATEAKQTFESELAKFKSNAEDLERKYNTAKAEYDAQKLMLSEEARTAKESELANLHQQYESYVQEVYGKGGKIELKNEELMAPVVKQINAVVQTIAQAENFTLIFDIAQGQIIYAQPGLDLTDRVITELNKEYQPITVAPAFKQKVAVFYLSELNPDARNSHLGKTCRDYLYALIRNIYGKKAQKVEMIDEAKFSQALQARGFTDKDIVDENTAKDIGREVGADFIITGSVRQDGNEITVTLQLSEIKFMRTNPPVEKKAAKSEFLEATLADILQILFNKYVK